MAASAQAAARTVVAIDSQKKTREPEGEDNGLDKG